MKSRGATLDTGFLIALERAKPQALGRLDVFTFGRIRLTVPAVVLAEWWRGTARQERMRKLFSVEPMDVRLAEAAGLALAEVPGATTNDAIVMASAARRDDAVYTSDFDDLARLRDQHFRGVRVLAF
jgi:predicted nucleic acid-binding protein